MKLKRGQLYMIEFYDHVEHSDSDENILIEAYAVGWCLRDSDNQVVVVPWRFETTVDPWWDADARDQTQWTRYVISRPDIFRITKVEPTIAWTRKSRQRREARDAGYKHQQVQTSEENTIQQPPSKESECVRNE